MLIQRRKFLKISSLATASLWLPNFLEDYQSPGAITHHGRILVMLQLSGGNDGLNTVIPVRNDIYYRERSGLAIQRDTGLALTDEAALHPALLGLRSLHDAGHLAVLNSVGYPNPHRSHFRSMEIWQSGSLTSEYYGTGWLGRYLDAKCNSSVQPVELTSSLGLLEFNDTLSLALKGQKFKGITLEEACPLDETAQSPYLANYAFAPAQLSYASAGYNDKPVAYLYKTISNTQASANRLYDKSGARRSKAAYPATRLGRAFRTIASLILADTDTSVYYVPHGSFDTHINQAYQHQQLLTEMNAALATFAKDMQANGRWNDVLVVTFSEFGRSVQENTSGGTDHGTANNMFFLGGRLRQGGLLNELPNLADLDDGGLKYKIDFRQVYATLLENWLQVESRNVLGERFLPMNFV